MSYKKNLVHRMAEKMQELALKDDGEKIDPYDAYDILSALFMMNPVAGDALADLACDIYFCRVGDDYELECELPIALDAMADEIAKHKGYESFEDYAMARCGFMQLHDQDGNPTYVYVRR